MEMDEKKIQKIKKEEAPKLSTHRAFRRVGAAVPSPLVTYFEKKLAFAGIREETRLWLGKRLLLSFLVGSILLLLYLDFFNPMATLETESIAFGLFFGGFLFVGFLFYLQLYFKIAERSSVLEHILPDFLSLTTSNLRAGMSPYEAFTHAARPEFGAFYDEVVLAIARMGVKTSISDALMEVSDHFDSAVLYRTVTLFAKGVRSGGQLAKLLNSSADEVRHIQDLRAELASATRTYAIFLGFIVVVVMPFLLSVSTQFVTVFLKVQSENMGYAEGASFSNVPAFSGKLLVTLEQMNLLSLVTLVMTCLLVSCLIGVVSHGQAIYGVKYFPILAVASVVMFFLARMVISGFLAAFST